MQDSNDPVLAGIAAYELVARQPDSSHRDQEAVDFTRTMSKEELTILHRVAWCLVRHASARLGQP